jgi:spore coat protein JB
MTDCNKLKNKLQAESFSLLETVLYLDGHPDCEKALCHYREKQAELAKLTDMYQKTIGPLTIYGGNCDTWQWVEGPWPWECEAN